MISLENGLAAKIFYNRPKNCQGQPDNRGGVTTVQIVDEVGNVLHTGIARCSENDNFNRSMGRTIAFGRAMKAMKENIPLYPKEFANAQAE